MIYLEVKAEHCEQLNRAIMRMLTPEHLRSELYTDLYCGMIEHKDGRMALILPDDNTVLVHPEATGNELSDMLSVFVADGAIPSEEAEFLIQSVPFIAGTRVRVIDLVPAAWNPYVRTENQMRSDGWFN